MKTALSRSIFPALVIILACLSPALGQNPTTSSYLYLSAIENTVFDELIKFWYLDTLNGPVNSNDTMAFQGLNGQPVFYDTVSTSAPLFLYFNGANPDFRVPPVFNAPRVALPERAEDVRNAATAQGNFFGDGGGLWAHRLVFSHSGWRMTRWPLGQSYQDSVVGIGGIARYEAIFVDGYLELMGLVYGRCAVGAHGSNNPAAMGYHCIKLMDDVRYWHSNPTTGAFDTTRGDMLLLISEGDIVIGNTPANGRDNGWNVYNHDPAYSSIIITGALVALGESFTFEDQNDSYIWEYSTGYIGPTPDRRGDIILRGSLAQHRRGYVHRSNHGDTGYGKRYFYDNRFDTACMPGSIKARHIPVLQPPQVNFGRIPVNQTRTQRVALKNAGGTYIDVQSGHVHTAAFSVNPIDSLTLSPNDRTLFQISFTPTAQSVYLDTLTIELYYGSDFKVPLRGVGVSGGILADREDVGEAQAQPEAFDLKLSPNPFNAQLHIECRGDGGPVDLNIRDLQGRVIEAARLQLGIYTWQPKNLSGGIYFVTMSSAKQTISRKVVYLK